MCVPLCAQSHAHMAASSIEWTDATWNPVSGCTRVSAGCDLCYAVTMTRRLAAMGSEKYVGLVHPGKHHFNGVVRVHPDALSLPLLRSKGTVFFVNSMSDLFHREVPFPFIAAVFGVMAATPAHTYQVLTKRPERMVAFFSWLEAQISDGQETRFCLDAAAASVSLPRLNTSPWPLPNVWLGTSVEDMQVVDRIEFLLETPAAVRFLSCEPLLGPLCISNQLSAGIDWVIAGGESGPGARPMKAEWVRSLRDQCAAASVPFFFKQWGGARKKASGRVLDGTYHDALPAGAHVMGLP